MASTMIHARVDEELKDTVTEILGNMGLTTSDVVRMLFTNIAANRGLPQGLAVDPAAHLSWFKEQVKEAMDSYYGARFVSPEAVLEDMQQMIEQQRSYNNWFIQQVQKGLAEADADKGLSADEVAAEFSEWKKQMLASKGIEDAA